MSYPVIEYMVTIALILLIQLSCSQVVVESCFMEAYHHNRIEVRLDIVHGDSICITLITLKTRALLVLVEDTPGYELTLLT